MTDESLFNAALALPPADRPAFLDANCPDPAVRREVEELLAAHAEHNPLDQTLPRPHSIGESSAAVGDRVGPYKLLEKIGEGGMGEVWVADQLEPIRRRVALKLIKPGMDSRSVLGRFEAERQALAVMDHPNIAKVLDAGTTNDGRPYFVMELVKGTPITEFADARKLTPKQRLELFVPVCQAIQHAHLKGIIHRDIKPGNVLVALHDEVPVPKVIDFGVAKAVGQQLTEKTIYTGFGALVGTPAYMAPEQATFNQLDVDTRADVYALGVLLYELLAGSPPIEKERLKKAALDEVLRLVREEEPPRPSQRLSTADTRASIAATRGSEPAKLSALLKGELDWIVMKALEKDRTRRYETANGFAADITRYLAGEPVQAVPPSLGYRVRKFVRKHRGPVIAAAVVAAAVLLGLAGTTGGMVWAVGAERQAKGDRDAAVKAEGEAAANAEAARTEAERVRDEQNRVRRLWYASEMARASVALAEGRSALVLQILADTTPKPGEPDLRGWEWHHLNRLFHAPIREVELGEPASEEKSVPALTVGPRSVATREDAAGGIWFEVYDTDSGKRVDRVPAAGALRWNVTPSTPPLGRGVPQEERRLLPFGRLSTDGRFLAAAERQPGDAGGNLLFRIRLWRVDTGEELDGPPACFPTGDFVVGPDAAWVAWRDSERGGDRLTQATQFRRWERASNAVTSRPLASVREAPNATITPDGRSVALTGSRGAVNRPDGVDDLGYEIACWDVTADPPKPRFPAIRIPNSRSTPSAISPAGSAAAVWKEGEVVVYDLADGEVRWRHTLLANGPRLETASLFGVSDDGRRVVFGESGRVTVVEHPRRFGPCREWSLRHPALATTSSIMWDGTRQGRLSPDGKTLYGAVQKAPSRVRLFDLTADPQTAGPDLRPQRTVEADQAGGRGLVVRDAGGREVGAVSGRGRWELFADRWVLFNTLPPFSAPFAPLPPGETTPAAWELHDTAGSKGPRRVAGGSGEAKRTAGGRYLLACDRVGVRVGVSGPGQFGAAPHWTRTTVYRAADGERLGEAVAPDGQVFVGVRAEPGGDRWAAFTCPAPTEPGEPLAPRGVELAAKPVPHTLRVYDLATGEERWSAEVGSGLPASGQVRFSRDGKRVTAGVWDGQRSTVHTLSLADGAALKQFELPQGVSYSPVAELPDGKVVLRSDLVGGGHTTVEVWDPATGTRTHRLTGHTQVNLVATGPDATRLFVLDGNVTKPEQCRVVVWDLTTGREVLSLPAEHLTAPNNSSSRPGNVRFEFAGGRLLYSSDDGLRVLDGTPLSEAKK